MNIKLHEITVRDLMDGYEDRDGDIKLMPGTASNPAFRNIDVDCDTGRVKGLF